MGLSWGQQEAQRVAERVDQSVDFGAQSALAAADRLIVIFLCAGTVLVGAPDGAVNHRIFVVGLGGQVLEEALPAPFLAQRLSLLCVFFQSPNRSGKSRQGIPVRYR